MPSKSTSPEGLRIGTSKCPFLIGKKLGEGACGTVHALEPIKTSKTKMDFVIKLAPLPSTKSVTGGKRKKTAADRNADLINYERNLYQNVLCSLRGTIIPDIPDSCSPPIYGEVKGDGNNKSYRYLVMERMAKPLHHAIPMLLSQTKKTNKSETIGEVAKSLISCLQALHERKYLFNDVKPENFMLSSVYSSNLSQSIRMLDFGLCDIFRADAFPGAPFEGTPMYASLNVLRGHTPSRRDDLEALGYVIGEMIILLVKGVNSGGKEILPWSECCSDEDILKVKEESVEGGNGIFFERMGENGNMEVEASMRKYFNIVTNMTFKKKPKYEELTQILQSLDVHISSEVEKKVIVKSKGKKHVQEENQDGEEVEEVRRDTSKRKKRAREENQDEEEGDGPVSKKPSLFEVKSSQNKKSSKMKTKPPRATRRNQQKPPTSNVSTTADEAPSKSLTSTTSAKNKTATSTIGMQAKRRRVNQPISYAEPSVTAKLRRGDVFFPKKDTEDEA